MWLPPDFVDVHNRRCWSPGCWRRALYGTQGTGSGAHACHEHRAPAEALLGAASARCVVANCSRVATFGAGHAGGKPLRCAHHRDAGDVDVRNRRCEAEMTGWDVQQHRPATWRCPQRASFGNPGEGRRRFCSLHRRRYDANLNNKRTCAARGCSLSPSFCDPATRRAHFCGRHRPPGFVHTSMLPPKGGGSEDREVSARPQRLESFEPQESDALWFCSSTSAIHRGAVDDANEAAGLRINHATGYFTRSTSLSPPISAFY